jgi:hypothetical protein
MLQKYRLNEQDEELVNGFACIPINMKFERGRFCWHPNEFLMVLLKGKPDLPFVHI